MNFFLFYQLFLLNIYKIFVIKRFLWTKARSVLAEPKCLTAHWNSKSQQNIKPQKKHKVFVGVGGQVLSFSWIFRSVLSNQFAYLTLGFYKKNFVKIIKFNKFPNFLQWNHHNVLLSNYKVLLQQIVIQCNALLYPLFSVFFIFANWINSLIPSMNDEICDRHTKRFELHFLFQG